LLKEREDSFWEKREKVLKKSLLLARFYGIIPPQEKVFCLACEGILSRYLCENCEELEKQAELTRFYLILSKIRM